MILKIDDISVEVISPDNIVSNSVNIYEIEFEFDDSWNDYDKKVVFSNDIVGVEVLLIDNKCIIPWEVLQVRGSIRVGVYGVKDDKVRPTVWSKPIRVLEGVNDCEDAKEPTPTVYEQMLGIMKNCENIAQSVNEEAYISNIVNDVLEALPSAEGVEF